MQKLGTRPRSFISGNICFEFSVRLKDRLQNVILKDGPKKMPRKKDGTDISKLNDGAKNLLRVEPK